MFGTCDPHSKNNQSEIDLFLVAVDSARALFNALCASDRRLAGISNAIFSVGTTRRVTEVGLRTSYSKNKVRTDLWLVGMGKQNDAPVWCETDLDVMEARVNAARSLSTAHGNVNAVPDFLPAEDVSLCHKINLPSGWCLLSEQGGWRKCPIGVYTNGVHSK